MLAILKEDIYLLAISEKICPIHFDSSKIRKSSVKLSKLTLSIRLKKSIAFKLKTNQRNGTKGNEAINLNQLRLNSIIVVIVCVWMEWGINKFDLPLWLPQYRNELLSISLRHFDYKARFYLGFVLKMHSVWNHAQHIQFAFIFRSIIPTSRSAISIKMNIFRDCFSSFVLVVRMLGAVCVILFCFNFNGFFDKNLANYLQNVHHFISNICGFFPFVCCHSSVADADADVCLCAILTFAMFCMWMCHHCRNSHSSECECQRGELIVSATFALYFNKSLMWIIIVAASPMQSNKMGALVTDERLQMYPLAKSFVI